MKVESWLFLGGIFFFTPVGIVYGIMVDWSEPVGFLGLFMLAGLSMMVGWYLLAGFLGLPWFARDSAGLAYLLGPTGGYLMALEHLAEITRPR